MQIFFDAGRSVSMRAVPQRWPSAGLHGLSFLVA